MEDCVLIQVWNTREVSGEGDLEVFLEDDPVDILEVNPAVIQEEYPANTQEENLADTQGEDPAVIQEENPAVTQEEDPAVTQGEDPVVTQEEDPAVTQGEDPVVTLEENPAVTPDENLVSITAASSGTAPCPVNTHGTGTDVMRRELILNGEPGYLSLVAYMHYYAPGSLRIQSRVHKVPVYQVWGLLDPRPTGGRRWLPRNEVPYPGYCRAPGSNICLPIFCDCEKLTQQWLVYKKSATKETNLYK